MSQNKGLSYESIEEIEALTNFEPDLTKLVQLKSTARKIIDPINKQAELANSGQKLIEMSNLSLLAQNLEKNKYDLQIIQKNIDEEIVKAEGSVQKFEKVLEQLKALIPTIPKESNLSKDLIGIITVNELKLLNYQNQLKDMRGYKEELSRFMKITIFHITDMLKMRFSSDSSGDKNILEGLKETASNFSSKKQYAKWSSIIFLIAAILNILASNFTLTSIFNLNIPFFLILIGVVWLFIGLFFIFKNIAKGSDDHYYPQHSDLGLSFHFSLASILYLFLITMVTSLAKADILLKNAAEYSFINGGPTATVIFLILSCLSFGFFRFLSTKQKVYVNAVGQLESSLPSIELKKDSENI